MNVVDKDLYEKAKKIVYKKYKVHSAYRSGKLVQMYKKLGGRYKGRKSKNANLTRWFKEKWMDVNPNKTKKSYPVYRPTRRVSKKTPLTVGEISKKELLRKSRLKQKIKHKTLPKFRRN